jgi:hypothetical protein
METIFKVSSSLIAYIPFSKCHAISSQILHTYVSHLSQLLDPFPIPKYLWWEADTCFHRLTAPPADIWNSNSTPNHHYLSFQFDYRFHLAFYFGYESSSSFHFHIQQLSMLCLFICSFTKIYHFSNYIHSTNISRLWEYFSKPNRHNVFSHNSNHLMNYVTKP